MAEDTAWVAGIGRESFLEVGCSGGGAALAGKVTRACVLRGGRVQGGREKVGSREVACVRRVLCMLGWVETQRGCWALTVQLGMQWMDTPVLTGPPELESGIGGIDADSGINYEVWTYHGI